MPVNGIKINVGTVYAHAVTQITARESSGRAAESANTARAAAAQTGLGSASDKICRE